MSYIIRIQVFLVDFCVLLYIGCVLILLLSIHIYLSS